MTKKLEDVKLVQNEQKVAPPFMKGLKWALIFAVIFWAVILFLLS